MASSFRAQSRNAADRLRPFGERFRGGEKIFKRGLDGLFGLPKFSRVERRKGSMTVKGAPALPGAA